MKGAKEFRGTSAGEVTEEAKDDRSWQHTQSNVWAWCTPSGKDFRSRTGLFRHIYAHELQFYLELSAPEVKDNNMSVIEKKQTTPLSKIWSPTSFKSHRIQFLACGGYCG